MKKMQALDKKKFKAVIQEDIHLITHKFKIYLYHLVKLLIGNQISLPVTKNQVFFKKMLFN